MPDYVVLVSTLGGISIFGINGFVIGPLIAALFMAAWTLLDEQERGAACDAERRNAADSCRRAADGIPRPCRDFHLEQRATISSNVSRIA